MTERYEQARATARAALKDNDFETARTALETAIGIRPSLPALLNQYAKVCQKTGDIEKAREALRRVLLLDPADKAALNTFALMTVSGGTEADKALIRDVKDMNGGGESKGFLKKLFGGGAKTKSADDIPALPDLSDLTPEQKQMFERGHAALAKKDYQSAVVPYCLLRDQLPDDPRVLRPLVEILSAVSYYDDLFFLLEKLVGMFPDELGLRAMMIRIAARTERFGLAQDMLDKLSPEERAQPDAVMAEAVLEYYNENSDAALDALNRLETLEPGRGDAVKLRARLLAGIGRFEEAAPVFEQWAKIDPTSAQPLTAAATSRLLKVDTPLFEMAKGMARNPKLPQLVRASVHFAMGKAYKAAKDYDNELDCLIKANALVDAIYDEEAEAEKMAAIEKHVTAALLSGQPDSTRGEGVIFVCGLPRSGSTLIAQVLSAHPEAVSIGESQIFIRSLHKAIEMGYPEKIADFTQDDFAELGEAYMADLPDYARASRYVVDKELSKYQHMGLVSLMLPGARIVHTRRNHMDTCYSMLGQNFPGWPAVFRQETLAQFVSLHDRITDHWAKALPRPAHEVHYENVVADIEGEIRKLLDAVDIPLHDDCLNFQQASSGVKTASSYQVRQKIYTGSINAWKKHEEGLSPLRTRLEELGVPIPD